MLKNTNYQIDYSQPDFYRFNEDSLKLVKWVQSQTDRCENLLDLGAGSGVIGLELAQKLSPKKITFLELQHSFMPHLKKNTSMLASSIVDIEIINSSFGNWLPRHRFDLIVCNPPYYLPGHGQKSTNPEKSICRSFDVDDWGVLLNLIENALDDQGKAFLVIKANNNILDLIASLGSVLKLEISEGNKIFFLKLTRLHK